MWRVFNANSKRPIKRLCSACDVDGLVGLNKFNCDWLGHVWKLIRIKLSMWSWAALPLYSPGAVISQKHFSSNFMVIMIFRSEMRQSKEEQAYQRSEPHTFHTCNEHYGQMFFSGRNKTEWEEKCVGYECIGMLSPSVGSMKGITLFFCSQVKKNVDMPGGGLAWIAAQPHLHFSQFPYIISDCLQSPNIYIYRLVRKYGLFIHIVKLSVLMHPQRNIFLGGILGQMNC